MPTYEYLCTKCSERSEAVQSFTDKALVKCSSCGGKLQKLFGSVGVVFKGPGFYRTDSRPAASTSGSSSGGGESSSKESSSPETPSSGSSADSKSTSTDKGPSTDKAPSAAKPEAKTA